MQLYRPSPRGWAAIAVLVAWVASLGWLAARRMARTETATLSVEAGLRLAPGASWFALYNGDLQVGQAGITLDTLSPGYQILETFSLEVPQDATVQRATRSTVTRVSPALLLASSRSRTVMGTWREDWLLSNTRGVLRLVGEGPAGGADLPVAVAPTTRAVLPYRLALAGGLAEGVVRTLPGYEGYPGALVPFATVAGRDSVVVFADSSDLDPVSGVLVEARRDTVQARGVVVRGDGTAERWWIDPRGVVVGRETAFGITWVRTDFDLAASRLRNRSPRRAATLAAAYPHVVRATRPTERLETTGFTLARRDGRPLDAALVAPLSGGRQRLRGDTLVVFAAGAAPADEDSTAAPRDLLADRADPALDALAARARAAAPGGRPLVSALLRQLAAKVVVDSAVTTLTRPFAVLRDGRASADGLAHLFVAAARSAGLQSRLAIGVRAEGDGFASHAWAEVWLDGRWEAVDPVFGRDRAATDLIRLGATGSSHPWQLLPQVSQLRVVPLSRTEEGP